MQNQQIQMTIINSDLLKLVGGVVNDQKFYDMEFLSFSSLKDGNSSSISFFNGAFGHLKELKTTKVGACFVKQRNKDKIPHDTIAIIVDDPYFAMAHVISEYVGSGEQYPKSYKDFSKENPHISQHAVISSTAKIGKNVRIMPYVYIGENVEINDNVVIHSHASLEHCTVGDSSIIRSGARIGTCGFGFVPNYITGEHFSIPQISKVILGKSVDIGANTTIDRGFLNDTTIGNFTKIDNSVQIGHGTTVGESCFIAAESALAGSVEIGNFCMIGGQSAIAGGVIMPDKTQIMGFSGVITGPKESGKTLCGFPAIDALLWKRMQVMALKNIKRDDTNL